MILKCRKILKTQLGLLLIILLMIILSSQLMKLDGIELRDYLHSNRRLTSDKATTMQRYPDGLPCISLASLITDSIPPIVHWTSKDGRVPSQVIPTLRKWRKILCDTNSEDNGKKDLKSKQDCSTTWNFMHWNDEQISLLISKHYPSLNHSYSKLVNGLERSDIGRLVVLHHVGGMYVDTDVELLRDPTPMLRPALLRGDGLSANFSCRSAVWSQEPVEHAVFHFHRPSLISNAVMLSQANHSFLSFVLNNWPAWFEQRWAKKTRRVHNDAVSVTGPLMLQQFYDKYTGLKPSERPGDWCGDMLADADAFQPIWDVVYVPDRLKKVCKKPEKLSKLEQQHCHRLNGTNFETKRMPNSSYTVHWFKHLSYTSSITKESLNISSMLPIFKCEL